MRRRVLWPIYGLVLLATGLAIYILYVQEQSQPAHQYWHIAALGGSLILAIGWIVASENTVRNAQRQHAITISLAYEYDRKSAERRRVIRKYLPTGLTQLVPDPAAKPEPIPPYSDVAHELYEAIDYELKFHGLHCWRRYGGGSRRQDDPQFNAVTIFLPILPSQAIYSRR